MSDPREPLPAMNRRMLVAGFCVYSLFLLFPIFALLVSRGARVTSPSPGSPIAELEGRVEGLRAELDAKEGDVRRLNGELAEAREAANRLEELEAFLKTADREQVDARIAAFREGTPHGGGAASEH